jgi:hypothetical protein
MWYYLDISESFTIAASPDTEAQAWAVRSLLDGIEIHARDFWGTQHYVVLMGSWVKNGTALQLTAIAHPAEVWHESQPTFTLDPMPPFKRGPSYPWRMRSLAGLNAFGHYDALGRLELALL